MEKQKIYLIVYALTLSIATLISSCKIQQQKQMDLEYGLLRFLHHDPASIIRQNTIDNNDTLYGRFLRYDYLRENIRSTNNPNDSEPFLNLDLLFTEDQKGQLINKFKELMEVQLDPDRMIAEVLPEEIYLERKENFDKIYPKNLSEPIVPRMNKISFPIIQKGINGVIYAITFDTFSFRFRSDSVGEIRVFVKSDPYWELLGFAPCDIQ
ncbi:hypothetical protein MM239_15840 [Belliella sp. DSM 111904]|uniref:DUF4829 domain-containing protein n=1 Tax=Belliella filtrata TaxID=2923435 RepID=A0ABS9V3W3_9BACT|nr:hypothetical protein [Belliella filtrata]MCH7410880.1 hypothetical protein [Belliella filtrata]